MDALLKLSLLLFSLFLIDQLGLWAERRGYVYWRHKKSKHGAAGAFVAMQAAFNPSAKHLIEVEEKKDCKERDGQGDDPNPTQLKFKLQ